MPAEKEKKQTLTSGLIFNICLNAIMFGGLISLLFIMVNPAPVVCTQFVHTHMVTEFQKNGETFTLDSSSSSREVKSLELYCMSRSNDPDKDIDWLTSHLKIQLKDLILVNKSVPLRKYDADDIEIVNVMYDDHTKEWVDIRTSLNVGLVARHPTHSFTVLVVAGPQSWKIFNSIISTVMDKIVDVFLIRVYTSMYSVFKPLPIVPDSWWPIMFWVEYQVIIALSCAVGFAACGILRVK